MKQAIKDIIAVSRHFGKQKSFTIGGGGNTSWKNSRQIWVKASGFSLSGIDERGFVSLDRGKLKKIANKEYPSDPGLRDELLKADLDDAILHPAEGKRPSVETSFHELIEYPFVVHTHSTHVNMLMCSRKARELAAEWFGDEVLYVPYAIGYDLFKKVQSELIKYRRKYGIDPRIILLQNHGVFVSGNTTRDIKQALNSILSIIEGYVKMFKAEELPLDRRLKQILPAMRMLLATDSIPVLRIRHNTLHRQFYLSAEKFNKGASAAFTPDMVVYAGKSYMYLEHSEDTGKLMAEFRSGLREFRKKNPHPPRIILIKNMGLVAVERDSRLAETALDIYEDLMMVSIGTKKFGGPHFLTPGQAAFIDSWEAEKYRRQLAGKGVKNGSMDNKTAIVTGAARGFGRGIAADLFRRGVNVVLADLLNREGRELADELNEKTQTNEAFFCLTDVSSPGSVEEMVFRTVCRYGGVDLLISNAGILKAGGLDEMDEKSFEKLTSVNYSGYFYCAKYVSEVMKVQTAHHDTYMGDIIQVNSKSGLAGSNRNFAYAGGKFGGIGLTQSFALELAPFRIKVNAVCPGNFFEGPLWSDPENGLFVQYLRAGKVPGARTIEDVKKYYENMVPLGRGCRVEDVTRAIYYIMEQEYETGQAVPVTGGQIMLS